MKYVALVIVFVTSFVPFISCGSSPYYTCDWALAARRGLRPTMEDTHIHDSKNGFFAVFDGHGGISAARYAQNNFPYNFDCACNEYTHDYDRIFCTSIEETDVQIQDECHMSGTTALIAKIDGTVVHLAWSGDSRGIVVRGNSLVCATQDHKPENELERLSRSSTPLFDTCVGKRIGVPYIASLAVSRALGDKFFKVLYPGIIGTPDVIHADVKKGDIILLACDGFWDVMTNEMAVALVDYSFRPFQQQTSPVLAEYDEFLMSMCGTRIQDNQDDFSCDGSSMQLQQIAQNMRDFAYYRGSSDNISVLVIEIA